MNYFLNLEKTSGSKRSKSEHGSDQNHDQWQKPEFRDSGKHPCGVCRTGVGSNSILYCRCQL